MLAAQHSPFHSLQPSPLTISMVLGEQRAAVQNQAVPASPNLSPLAPAPEARSISQAMPVSSGAVSGKSPSPAVVPVFSGSPLLRQILKGKSKLST
jgi:hypothetical protein